MADDDAPRLEDLGGGLYAYIQPDGSWGLSNAGLVSDGDESLLVDTLYDLPRTQRMLDALAAATPAARRIDALVNTHANGDHCYGNQLVGDTRIIASSATAEEMGEVPPEVMAAMLKGADEMGEAGEFLKKAFGAFEFEGITLTPPNETFEGQLDMQVGDHAVELIEVGPAHTRGDVLVHVPDARVIFTGDILFIDGTPIMWAGPVANWIDACEKIAALEPEVIVPGHGPLTDVRGALAVRDYLVYVRDEARKRFDAGLSAREAALDIQLGDFSAWLDSERIAVNVAALYREFGDTSAPEGPMETFELMAELDRRARRA
ncbi:MAG: MBL fold metallo-hydrolase [Deltaproteobacteria bacterium]|jgi:glyoxylase-like metal-dependent hydrolase (beta-lactamase superfamily II)|nr:MBL fold metallo-hydrolase [Deltaproteobacteria bacterium]